MSADEIAFSEIVDDIQARALFGPRWVLARATLKQQFLIEGAIPSSAVTMIAGAPGEKKSWLAYAAALSVARGEPWLNFPAPSPGRVVVANYDNPTRELARRFLRLGLRDSDEGQIYFHTRDDAASSDYMLRLPEHSAKLISLVSRIRPRMVLIDSLRQCHTADENSSKEMADVMSTLKALTADGCAVVVIHHTKKPSARDDGMSALLSMRGSGEIAGSIDAAIVAANDVALWAKHRGWEIADLDASVEFAVKDIGDRTFVVAT